MKKLILILGVLALMGCREAPKVYPKYHLAQQVIVEDCVGVVIEARVVSGMQKDSWEYTVAFELKCDTCKKMPGWMTKVYTQTFKESELQPVGGSEPTITSPEAKEVFAP